MDLNKEPSIKKAKTFIKVYENAKSFISNQREIIRINSKFILKQIFQYFSAIYIMSSFNQT